MTRHENVSGVLNKKKLNEKNTNTLASMHSSISDKSKKKCKRKHRRHRHVVTSPLEENIACQKKEEEEKEKNQQHQQQQQNQIPIQINLVFHCHHYLLTQTIYKKVKTLFLEKYNLELEQKRKCLP